MTQYVVSSGQTSGGLSLSAGEEIFVDAGGTGYAITLNGGGGMTVAAGGSGYTIFVHSSGELAVDGHASEVIVYSGGSETVYDGGTSFDTIVSSGGWEFVSSGGTAIGTTVSGGLNVAGMLEVSSGAVASDTTLINTVAGGYDGVAFIAGSGVDTIVSSGGDDVVIAGGTDFGATVLFGGLEEVAAGGTAVNITVSSGANQFVAGGTASGTVIDSLGLVEVESGYTYYFSSGSVTSSAVRGTTVDARINSGGYEYVSSDAIAISTTVSSGGTLSLGPGGSAVDTIVLAGGTVISSVVIRAGQTSSGLVVPSTENLYVDSGGSAVDVTVSGGGFIVLSGGVAIDTTVSGGTGVNTGSYMTVDSGGTASGIVLVGPTPAGSSFYEAVAVVFGSAVDTTVSSGGSEQIESGGTATGTVIEAGGGQLLYSGAVVSDTTVSSGGNQYVDGGIAVNTTVDGFATQQVNYQYDYYFSSGSTTSSAIGSAGTTLDTVISSGGIENVTNGVASATTVSSGGTLSMGPGGSAVGTNVLSGGHLDLAIVVSPGQTSSGLIVTSGETLYVLAGGSAVDVTVSSGGAEAISSGGVATSTTVANFAEQYVYAGGVASDTTLSGDQFIFSRGSAVSTTVASNGGYENIAISGTAIATVVQHGGEQYVDGGTAISTTMLGTEFIVGAYFYTFSSGTETSSLTATGTSLDTTVSGGGFEYVSAGGVASATTVSSGATLSVGLQGNAVGTVLISGGTVIAPIVVSAGQTSSGIVVSSGQTLQVSSGGSAVDATVSSGGTANVISGGTAVSTTVIGGVATGGTMVVSAGGVASATTLIGPATASGAFRPGIEDVYGGAAGTVVSSGGYEEVLSHGTASATAIDSGGQQTVFSAGTAAGATVNRGGVQTVSSAGTASNTTIGSGGTEVVAAGGTASGTMVDSGGLEEVFASGSAGFGTVSSGGTLAVFSGGVANGETVLAGGTLIVLPGGSATNTTGAVVSGGVVLYQPGVGVFNQGTSATGLIVSSGGTEFLLSGGTATSTTLNYGASIDDTALPFAAGGTAGVNSTTDLLTVSVGGETYTQQLAGNYTSTAFSLAADGDGGTTITETAAPVTVEPGTTVTVSALLPTQPIDFISGGAPETLIIAFPAGTVSNPINGFAGGDNIEFASGTTLNSLPTVSNGDTVTASVHNASGVNATYVFTDLNFAAGTPTVFTYGVDPQSNDWMFSPIHDFEWIGTTSGNLDLAANWDDITDNQNPSLIVPGQGSYLLMNAAGGGTLSGTAAAEVIQFYNGGSYALASGTTLATQFQFFVGVGASGTFGTGNLTVGSGSTIDSAGYLDIGTPSGSNGTLTISGGGQVFETIPANIETYEMEIGGNAASGALAASNGIVLVTGSGSLLDLENNGLAIADNGGNGSLTISQGGSVYAATANSNINDSFAIGRIGNGTMTVTDPGSEATGVGVAYIDHSGSGTLTVENSGIFQVLTDPLGLSGLLVGVGSTAGTGGTAVANVLSSGELISQGYVSVGIRGTQGTLNVNDGTVQVGTSLVVGAGGTIAPGTIESGNGTLNIGAGGTVLLTGTLAGAYGVDIGNSNDGLAASETGAATVSGAGALLDANGNGIAVGLYGDGTLTVSQGGSVVGGTPNSAQISALSVGRQGDGSVTVTGAGSQLTANGAVYIGRAGIGSLTVENLGSVTINTDGQGGGDFDIGGAGTSTGGSLFVGGAGSALLASGGSLFSETEIRVGLNGASGTLTIVGGGTVEAAQNLLIGSTVTLDAGDVVVSDTATTTLTAATAFAGSGTVVVGAGGMLRVDGTGFAGTPDVVVGGGAGSNGVLSVTGSGALLADGSGTIAIGGAGSGTLDVASGGSVQAAGIANMAGGTILLAGGAADISGVASNAGTISGFGTLAGSPANSGTVVATGGTLDITGSIGGTGELQIGNDAALRLDAAVGIGQSIGFGSDAALILNAPGTAFGNALTSLNTGDVIEFGNGMTVTGASLVNGNTIAVEFHGSGGLPGSYDLTDAGFAAGASQQFSVGTDAATGDSEIVVGSVVAVPTITAVSWDNATETVVIDGSGFGSQPAYDGDSAFIDIVDGGPGASFAAGYAGSGVTDAVSLDVTSWTDDEITIQGFGGAYGQGGTVFSAGDAVTVWVANPQETPPTAPTGSSWPASLTLTIPAANATFTWTGATSSDWNTAANWSPNGPPFATATALVPTGSAAINGETAVVAALGLGGLLSGPSAGVGTVSVVTGGALDVTGEAAVWNGSTLDVDAASSVDIGTSGSAAAGTVLVESGHALLGDGVIVGSVVNNGTIDVTNSGTLGVSRELTLDGAVSGSGTIEIASGATLQIDGALGAGQTIAFAPGAPETLILGSPASTMSNPITGFTAGDRLEFSNGITVTGGALLSGDTFAVSYHDALGNPGVYNLTDMPIATVGPLSFDTGIDDATGEAFIFATTFLTWTGASNSNFGTAANWNLGTVVPSTEVYALFNNGVGGTISGSGTVEGINFSNTGTWYLAPGTSLDVAGPYFTLGSSGGGARATGALVIGAGSTITTTGGNALIAADAGGVATLIIDNGGVLRNVEATTGPNYAFYIGENGASGTLAPANGMAVVTGAGSLLDLTAGGLSVGAIGASGDLTVSQGGSIIAGTTNSSDNYALAIGEYGNGTVTVTDPGSEVRTLGNAYLAHSGSGTLVVENFATFMVGLDPTGVGGLTIGAGKTLSAGLVGVGGTGYATVTTDGLLYSTTYLNIGSRGDTGQLSVLNNGTVEVGTTLTVGSGGTLAPGVIEPGDGTLAVGAGGTVALTGPAQTSSYGVYISNSNDGTVSTETGVATVSGAGALLNTNGNGLAVAQYGTATLTVSQGGSVLAGTANSNLIDALAVGFDGAGTLTVTDAGSYLGAAGLANIGEVGSGTLIVENHAGVTIGVDGLGDGGLDIGDGGSTIDSGGTGSVLVTTDGDLLVQTDIVVGTYGDSGSLTVTNGGTVEVGQSLQIGNPLTISPALLGLPPTPPALPGAGTVTVGAGGVLRVDGNGVSGIADVFVGGGNAGTALLDVTGAGAELVDAGGVLNVGGPAESSTVSVSDGGVVEVESINNDGTVMLAGGTIATSASASSTISFGGNSNSNVLSGFGTFIGPLTNIGTVTATGGTLDITGSISGNGTLAVSSGSDLTLNGAIGSGQVVDFLASTGMLAIDDVAGFQATVAQFAGADAIIVQTAQAATFSQSGSLVSVIVNGATSGEITFASAALASYAMATPGALQAEAICFVKGTRIATPAGEVPVEQLAVGDRVITLSGAVRPIVWIGVGQVLATRGRRGAATPVVVCKGALGENLPHRDLHVTKGHALYINNVLIPVEFLVNHRSIYWDDRAQQVAIYHIELETHDVLLADGAPAESYRDDGNRWLFQNGNTGWGLPPKPPCAPVLTGGPLVDAAWRQLLDRAGPRPALRLTDDPDLHLVIDGQRVDAVAHWGTACVFPLAARAGSVRIVSRAGAPAELGTARDPRTLGVAVRRVVVREGSRFHSIEASDAALSDGFHAFEPEIGLRWTDGDAGLPTALFRSLPAPAELVVHLGGTTQYPLFGGSAGRAAA